MVETTSQGLKDCLTVLNQTSKLTTASPISSPPRSSSWRISSYDFAFRDVAMDVIDGRCDGGKGGEGELKGLDPVFWIHILRLTKKQRLEANLIEIDDVFWPKTFFLAPLVVVGFFISGFTNPSKTYILPKLTASKRPWNWMVGRRSFPFGMAQFQGFC